jgi:tetratricopeptide (TPR) repeat protein
MKPTKLCSLTSSCAAALAALWLAGACASTPTDEPRDTGWLIAHGHYEEAVRHAAEQHDAYPDQPQFERMWRRATVALLLDQGRKLTFEDRDLEALDKFRAAQELEPSVPQTQNWIDATLDKLATHWTTTAQEWHSKNNLEQAIEAYETALSYRDDRDNAKQGLARALLQLNFRNGKSDEYYKQGVAALDEYWLYQASHGFDSSLKYKEDHERAEERKQETARAVADERVRLATELEDRGQFAAARSEYRIATLVDPTDADAKEGLERARREDKAAECLREADRRTMHGEFDKADQALAKGAALTERQADAFEAARQSLVEARMQKLYDDAKSHEKDRDYEQAVAGYEAVLVEAERLTGQRMFKDTIAIKDSLEQAVRDAKALYAQVATVTDPAEQLRLLRKLEVIWPEYLDVRERIAALEGPTDGAGDQPRR